jgi:hypothetical protein
MAEESTEATIDVTRPHRRDWTAGVVGLLVFFGGIGLLVITFQLAYGMFNVPVDRALNMDPSKPLNVGDAGQRFVGIVIRILLLLVMAVVGSLIANRGIKLYSDASKR